LNIRRVFLWTCTLSLGLVYILLWLGMITDPVQYTGTDFVPFYAAAQIAHNDGPERIYDFQLQKTYEEKLAGFEIPVDNVRIYLNPPFVVPLASLVALPNFVVSLVLWDLLMGLFLLLGTGVFFHLLKNEFPQRQLWIFLLGLLFFFPGYRSLVIGQNSAMLYLGGCIWFFGLVSKKNWLAGLGLALMTVRPHLVLPLALPFLFKRRGVFGWFLLGAGCLALFSLFYAGLDGIAGFIKMLTLSGSGANSTTGEASMNNLVGVLVRTFPSMPITTVHWVGWGTYLVTIIGLCLLWIRVPEVKEMHIGLAILITLFTSPHLHMHDLVLWSIPLVILLRSMKLDPALVKNLVWVPWMISMAFLFCFFSPIIEAIIPYLILIYLGLALYHPEKWLRLPRFKTRGTA
jgi:hypothetical protein